MFALSRNPCIILVSNLAIEKTTIPYKIRRAKSLASGDERTIGGINMLEKCSVEDLNNILLPSIVFLQNELQLKLNRWNSSVG